MTSAKPRFCLTPLLLVCIQPIEPPYFACVWQLIPHSQCKRRILTVQLLFTSLSNLIATNIGRYRRPNLSLFCVRFCNRNSACSRRRRVFRKCRLIILIQMSMVLKLGNSWDIILIMVTVEPSFQMEDSPVDRRHPAMCVAVALNPFHTCPALPPSHRIPSRWPPARRTQNAGGGGGQKVLSLEPP